ncbi:MAG: Cof-type HAD-IIB family hydrolase [Ignavibacteriae bacterium]|nr:Cof-type HAD-IIB family hydrolase [Ignavibacteriota bacterium]
MVISKEELRSRLSRIKLVVSDVDGTLTTNENELGEMTKELVKKLDSKGILTTFATQRIHSSIVDFARELDIKVPMVTINGALIQDLKGNAIYKAVINPKYVNKAIKFCDEFFVRLALVYNDEIIYTESNSVLKDFMFRIGTNYRLVDSYKDYVNDVLEIIMMGNEKSVIKHIQKKMNFPFKFYVYAKYYRSSTRLGIYNLEIRKTGTTKRTGLTKLAKHLKLKKHQIAVIGDWYNDRELFEFGGLNVALQNAVAELKNKAHYITEKTNNEDGVGEFLKLLYDSV